MIDIMFIRLTIFNYHVEGNWCGAEKNSNTYAV